MSVIKLRPTQVGLLIHPRDGEAWLGLRQELLQGLEGGNDHSDSDMAA